jgi:hypothetical protein
MKDGINKCKFYKSIKKYLYQHYHKDDKIELDIVKEGMRKFI